LEQWVESIDRLRKEYKTKEVRPPVRFRKDKNTLEHLRFNINRFHGRVGSANNMVQIKPSRYYTKTGNDFYNPTNIPLTAENQPIEPRKEIKSAYSYNRPVYVLDQLNIEKNLIEAKNIELKEKRNQEEIKKFMDEAAIAKAKFKEKREIKFSMDNIIKEYEKTFKVDKTADELIKEQKEKEENKDNRISEFINANLSYNKNTLKLNVNPNVLSDTSVNVFKNSNNNTDLNNKSSKNNLNINTSNKDILDINKISSKFPNCYTNINNKVIYSKIENKDDFAKVEEEILSSKNEENQNEPPNEEANSVLRFIQSLYDIIVEGKIPGMTSVDELAAYYSNRDNYSSLEQGANAFVRWQNGKCAADGFLTSLPGFVLLTATIPANLVSTIMFQIQTAATIARMAGRDLHDESIKTLVIMCLCGQSVKSILAPLGVNIARTLARGLVIAIPRKLLGRINAMVGAKLFTKFSSKGIIQLGRAVPLLGGLVGGACDLYFSNRVGNAAIELFITGPQNAEEEEQPNREEEGAEANAQEDQPSDAQA